MRESPLPDSAGVAGFFDVDGRVVVAIAKCMAMCGLRPEGVPGRPGINSAIKEAAGSSPAAFHFYSLVGYGKTGAGACSCCGRRTLGGLP